MSLTRGIWLGLTHEHVAILCSSSTAGFSVLKASALLCAQNTKCYACMRTFFIFCFLYKNKKQTHRTWS